MKNYKLYKVSFVALLTALCFSCKNSQKEESPIDTVKEINEVTLDDTSKEADAQFIVKATEISLAEIQLGQLAQKLGSSGHVREMGKMMETDHAKALAEITELAKTKEVTIPSAPTFDAQDAYNKLNAKSSVEFDKAYADKMVTGHQEAIALFEKTCNESTDAEVREWATKMLPVLKLHFEHALMCQKESNKK